MKISEEEVAVEAIRHALKALRKRHLAEEAAHAPAITAVSRPLVYQGSKWKEKAEKLDLELQLCYKTQSQLSEQLVVEDAELRASKALLEEKESLIAELQKEVPELRSECSQFKSLLEEKTKGLELVVSENNELKIQIEEAILKAKTTEAENKTLIDRWMLQKMQDAERINEVSIHGSSQVFRDGFSMGGMSQVDGADLVGAVTTSGELHGDLMIQILGRLPIKSILRFKSVCRAWYDLLNSPRFIQEHCDIIRSSIEMSNTLSLLVHIIRYSFFNDNDEIFSVLLECSCGDPSMKNIELPFEGNLDYIQIVGTINGLICLSLSKDFKSFVLWNPAIRKHSHIQQPQLVVGKKECVCGGFAYDRNSDSYKVIRILYIKDSYKTVSIVPKVEIYNTVTGTWRTTETVDLPWLPYQHKGGVVVSGSPYWFSPRMDETSERLIWFDASTETFGFHTLPPDGNGKDRYYSYLLDMKAMGEQIALLSCKYHRSLDSKSSEYKSTLKRAEIRKLKKTHNGGNVLFEIEKSTIEQFGPYLARIVGFGRHGEVIAEGKDYNTLLLCDREENKPLARYGEGFSKVYDYNETLVWPSVHMKRAT